MSKDFLSQKEVDALLRGVTDDKWIPADYSVYDIFEFNEEFVYVIHAESSKMQQFLEEHPDAGQGSGRQSTFIVPEKLMTFIKLKFSDEYTMDDDRR